MKQRLLIMFVLLSLALATVAAAQDAAEETPVRIIELTGPAAAHEAEISSLAWYGDILVLMTENANLYADEEESGAFFALAKQDILAYLDADDPAPLEPFRVPIYGPAIVDAVSEFGVLFDGFEAITFVDAPNAFAADQVFLTIEAYTTDAEPRMHSYLVWGTVDGELEGIQLNLDDYIELPIQSDIGNKSYESLLNAGDGLIALYEVNSAHINEGAFAIRVDLATGVTSEIDIDSLEFRLTDVTELDAEQQFWAVNYFFSGDTDLKVESDPLFETYGMGTSQAAFGGHERLVKYEVTGEGLALVDIAPVQLLQTEESNGRNWEGIALLDDRGALIVTDRFPQTLLGLVKLPAE